MTATNALRIATRSSPLALWQANYVKDRLQQLHPELQIELIELKTRGDKILDAPLAKVGGKGLFVKELEQAMLEGRADLAVHSMKDVPMEFPEGLGLSVICEREDPRDAFVSNQYSSFKDLPQGAKLGTSSLRRQCQLMQLRPDLRIEFLRGNVNTRLRKLDEGQFDAIILATAGLVRLDLAERIRERIEPETCLPAGGQGAVGIETRTADPIIEPLLAPLHHKDTAQCVIAERALNRRLQGGCQVPIGCFAQLQGDELHLRGLVGALDGSQIIHSQGHGPAKQAEQLGISVAEDLLAQGAQDILDAVYKQA